MHQKKQDHACKRSDAQTEKVNQERSKKQRRLNEDQPCVSSSMVENLIVEFVVQDLQPLSVVEGVGFRRMIEGLNSKAKIMCSTTLKDCLQAKFCMRLHECDFVCTTADFWTQQARSYIGVTCHWIDEDDLQRHSVALAFRRFKGVHSYDKIALTLKEIHGEFDLDTSKIVNVVTDNSSNFMKAFREFSEPGIFYGMPIDNQDIVREHEAAHTSEADDGHDEPVHIAITDLLTADEYTESSGIYLPSHLSCFSHTLNLLATTDANKALTSDGLYKRMYRTVASKCTSLSNASHQSSKAAETVFEILSRTNPKPNTTRWNSEYDCYSVILDLKEKINIVMERLQLPKFSLQDFSFLAEWVEAMRFISQALDKFQGEFTAESYRETKVLGFRGKYGCSFRLLWF